MSQRVKLESKSIEVPDSLEAIYQTACEEGWGDGLPIVPPTEERVEKMVEYAGRGPSEVIASLAPLGGEATVEKIAINAVMAGCLPEYLPVVIAAVQAMGESQFNLHGIQTTTNPVGPLLIVNGPIRRNLNINCRGGCLGPGWRANATIGRAIRLILLNIGGGVPQTVDKAMHGFPGKYAFCFGEDEEESPWEPLHVERGFDREVSTVTVVGAQATHNVATMTPNWRTWVSYTAGAVSLMGNNDMYFGKRAEPVAVLTGAHASVLAKEGFSKLDVKRLVFERSGVPESEMPADAKIGGSELFVVDGRIVPCERAEKIMLVVAGGPIPYHLVVIPTCGFTSAVTKEIKGDAGSA